MEIGEFAAGLDEAGEILNLRDSRQHLLKISGEFNAVCSGVQQSVDVIEDVVLGDFRAI